MIMQDISAKTNILGISPSCDRIGRTRTVVHGVETANRIDLFLEIGQGTIEAWLECHRFTACKRIDGVDRGEHCVRV